MASDGSSCSAMYHSTPAARAAVDDVREPQDAAAGRDVAPVGAGAAVLHVEQADAIGRVADGQDRVATADGSPVDVEFEHDLGWHFGQQDVPDRCPVEGREFEGVVVVAEAKAASRKDTRQLAHLRSEPVDVGDSDGRPRASRDDYRRAAGLPTGDRQRPSGRGAAVSMPSCEATTLSPASSSSRASSPGAVGGRPATSTARYPLGDLAERSRQVRGDQPSDGVELERDLVLRIRIG